MATGPARGPCGILGRDILLFQVCPLRGKICHFPTSPLGREANPTRLSPAETTEEEEKTADVAVHGL